jgi:hypothetical protein
LGGIDCGPETGEGFLLGQSSEAGMRKIWGVALGLMLALASVAPAAQPPAPGQTPAATAAPVDLAVVHQYLVGTWQNDADTRQTRELDADGRAFDRLAGEESDSEPGSWHIFLGSAPPAKFTGIKFDPKVVYLEIDRDGDTFLYAVLQVSRSEMHMVYLQQNQQLGYSRLK